MPSPRFFLVGFLALAGCAHVPMSAESATSEKPERMLVTGSRIPRPVDPRTGRPATFSQTNIYTRKDLLATGSPSDLGVALNRLEVTAR